MSDKVDKIPYGGTQASGKADVTESALDSYRRQANARMEQLNAAIAGLQNGGASPAVPDPGISSVSANNPLGPIGAPGALGPSAGTRTYIGANGGTYQDTNRTGFVLAPNASGRPSYQFRIDGRAPLSEQNGNFGLGLTPDAKWANQFPNSPTAGRLADNNVTVLPSRHDQQWANNFPNSPTAQRVDSIMASLPKNNGVPASITQPNNGGSNTGGVNNGGGGGGGTNAFTLPPAYSRVGNSGRDYGNGTVYSPYGTVSRNPVAGSTFNSGASVSTGAPPAFAPVDITNSTANSLKLQAQPQRTFDANNTFPQLPQSRF